MFTMNDILALLNEGNDAGAIANDFTNALNAAIVQKKREEAEAKTRAKAKEMCAERVMHEIHDFLAQFYPHWLGDGEVKVSGADVVKALDGLDAELKSLFEMLAPKNEKPIIMGGANDPITKFLKDNGLV